MKEKITHRNIGLMDTSLEVEIEVVERCGMKPFPGGVWLHATGPTCEGLLAFVLGQAKPGQRLVTLQGEWLRRTEVVDVVTGLTRVIFDATYAFADAGVSI